MEVWDMKPALGTSGFLTATALRLAFEETLKNYKEGLGGVRRVPISLETQFFQNRNILKSRMGSVASISSAE